MTQAQTVFWNESSGDLSNNQNAPGGPFILANGANSVIGSVNASTDFQDWLTLNVPAGFQLSSLTLVAYTSTDGQGFTGVQSGTFFNGSPFVAANYLGYAHFGFAAQNPDGSLPPVNLIGADILPIMGNPSTAPGAQGFTPPLPAGDYTFLIQQAGSALTSYQFDYNVTPVPEPRTQAVVGGILVGAYFLRRRLAKAKAAA